MSNLRLPWKQSCPEIFAVWNIVFTFRFFEQLALALKNRVALIFFTALNMYFLLFRIFEELALGLKNRVGQKVFAVWNILFTFRFFEQLALAVKNRGCPEFFRCISYIFYYSGVLSNLRLPWKTEGALKFFTVFNICFIIQEFWATCACPENRVALEFLHCIEYTFYIQDFWVTCACPEKQRVPWIYCIECRFFIFRIFEQLALALKNRVALEFFTVLKYISLFRILSNLRLPLKQSWPWNFSRPGGGRPPRAPPRLVRRV